LTWRKKQLPAVDFEVKNLPDQATSTADRTSTKERFRCIRESALDQGVTTTAGIKPAAENLDHSRSGLAPHGLLHHAPVWDCCV